MTDTKLSFSKGAIYCDLFSTGLVSRFHATDNTVLKAALVAPASDEDESFVTVTCTDEDSVHKTFLTVPQAENLFNVLKELLAE